MYKYCIFQERVALKFDSSLGVSDFYLPNGLVVLYIGEADLVSGNAYRQKVAKFKSGKSTQNVVFVESTALSEQYFQDAQKFIVFDLKLDIISVSSQADAANALANLVSVRSQQGSNPFLDKRRLPPVEVTMAKALQAIPNIGPTKVQSLMGHFTDVVSISQANCTQLAAVLSMNDAQHVYNFFHH